MENLRDVNFSEFFDKVHDWRNYVPEKYTETWLLLSDETRTAIYEICEDRANDEEWD